jgi:hypothetical protein
LIAIAFPHIVKFFGKNAFTHQSRKGEMRDRLS